MTVNPKPSKVNRLEPPIIKDCPKCQQAQEAYNKCLSLPESSQWLTGLSLYLYHAHYKIEHTNSEVANDGE